MRPLVVSSGEPAGIGPDLCIALADFCYPLVVLADPYLLESRARELNKTIQLAEYNQDISVDYTPGTLRIIPVKLHSEVLTGQVDPKNASYVIELLTQGAKLCEQGVCSGLITAPVHKAVLNEGGFKFTGHTEFYAEYFRADNVVMMFSSNAMRLALVTTHLPLNKVSEVINKSLIIRVIRQVHKALKEYFGVPNPLIKVSGLNPHAGESGYLGQEEIETIIPALTELRTEGLHIIGPLPADTMFSQDPFNTCDAYITMYHDQGLPVLKYAGFHEAVNITLGLPIIRTSVDHGTALDLAGTNQTHPGSMIAAVELAMEMATKRNKL